MQITINIDIETKKVNVITAEEPKIEAKKDFAATEIYLVAAIDKSNILYDYMILGSNIGSKDCRREYQSLFMDSRRTVVLLRKPKNTNNIQVLAHEYSISGYWLNKFIYA